MGIVTTSITVRLGTFTPLQQQKKSSISNKAIPLPPFVVSVTFGYNKSMRYLCVGCVSIMGSPILVNSKELHDTCDEHTLGLGSGLCTPKRSARNLKHENTE